VKTKKTRGKFNIGKSIGDKSEDIKKKNFWALGAKLGSFSKRREQSLLCNICG
jgi:hypothetical protein